MSHAQALDRFKRNKVSSAIAAGLSLVVLGALPFDKYAHAQDSTSVADDDEDDEADALLEEVIVTGFKSSLQSSQDIKQMSNVVVDSITAEDIGALPDQSVTEALQRVPGVAINRFAAGRDPDHFSVEGAGVVVRGLTYVRSEINGRDSFTANNGRGLSFADVSAELLGGVDVFKSLSADKIEGGIAGTVNLRTRKPFDQDDNYYGFSAEAQYSDFIEEISPSVSGLASWRWDTGAGEFGLLVSGVYAQTQSRADRFQVSNFAERTLYSNGDVIPSEGATPVQEVLFPRGAVMGTQEFDRERYGFSAALQWRSEDESLEATAEFLRSDSRETWTERAMEIATDVVTDQGDARAVPGTMFGFTDSGVFDSGYITGPTGWRDDQWSGDPRTPTFGLQSNNIQRQVDQQFVTDDASINLKWYVTDDWALNFDYQHVDSKVDNLDAGIWGSSYQDLYMDLNGNDLPFVQFVPIQPCTGPTSNECPTYWTQPDASFIDPRNTFYRAAMDHIEESEGTSDAFRIDASKTFSDSDWVESIQFGVRYADRDQTARFSTYNWGVLSEIWGSGGPVWFDEDVVNQGAGVQPFYFDNFFDGRVANPLGGDGRLFYAGDITGDYEAYYNYALAVANTWRPDNPDNWMPLHMRPDVVAGTPFLVGEINPVQEQNQAVYFTLNFDHELDNGWNLGGNIGVRYTDTNREAQGYQQFPNTGFQTEEECTAPLDPGQTRTEFCQLTMEERQSARNFANGATTPVTSDLDYDYWLPSVNVLLRTSDELQFRASYFKGVAPPDFGLTRLYENVTLDTADQSIIENGGVIGRFSAGNPYLLPVESNNFDLTAEWYFADVGQLTFALFYKELDNIRTNSVERMAYTNNGETFEAIVTTAVNSPDTGKIKGFEIAYQQTYDFFDGWLSGFGIQANYTYVDSSNVPQSTLSETDPDVAAGNQSTVDISRLPLEGLSKHTFNITPFYEYGDWSARLAYSWRDEFLLTIRDVIVPFQPIYNEATGQLDGSVFYSINDNFRIGVQAVNLTGEVIRTSAVVNDDLLQAPRSWYVNDRRYSLILRGTF